MTNTTLIDRVYGALETVADVKGACANKWMCAGSISLWIRECVVRSRTPVWTFSDLDIFVAHDSVAEFKAFVMDVAVALGKAVSVHPRCPTILELQVDKDICLSFIKVAGGNVRSVMDGFDLSVVRVGIYPATRAAPGSTLWRTKLCIDTAPGVGADIDSKVATIYPLSGKKDADGNDMNFADHRMIRRMRKYQERGFTFRIGAAKPSLFGAVRYGTAPTVAAATTAATAAATAPTVAAATTAATAAATAPTVAAATTAATAPTAVAVQPSTPPPAATTAPTAGAGSR